MGSAVLNLLFRCQGGRLPQQLTGRTWYVLGQTPPTGVLPPAQAWQLPRASQDVQSALQGPIGSYRSCDEMSTPSDPTTVSTCGGRPMRRQPTMQAASGLRCARHVTSQPHFRDSGLRHVRCRPSGCAWCMSGATARVRSIPQRG